MEKYLEYNKVKFYFIDNEYYFKREGNIYGFYDDGERFAFFSRAALDAIARLNIYPDVLHCNDWQTAAAVIFLKGMYYREKNFRKIKTIFTIHNILGVLVSTSVDYLTLKPENWIFGEFL